MFIFILLIGFLSIIVYRQFNITNNVNRILCLHPYANCTTAKCITSSTKNTNICYCDVMNDVSMGNKPCNQLKPYSDQSNDYIYSTFNPTYLYNGYKIRFFPGKNKNSNSPNNWTDCLNSKCIIDKANPSKAFCYCNDAQTIPPKGFLAFVPINFKGNYKGNLSGGKLSLFNDNLKLWQNHFNVDFFEKKFISYY